MIKTNAARLLDAAGIGYELIPYEFSEDDLSAGKVAASLGEDVERVFKTLVLRGDRNGVFVCVIPGDFEVDLKLAASISGNKSCAMVHVKELLGLTGYIRGGCSPIGMKALRLYLRQRWCPRSSDEDRALRPLQLHRRGNLSDLISAACDHKHPSQARRACSWMIWPSGGGALPAVVAVDYTLWQLSLLQIVRCSWFYVSAASVCFSRFAICCCLAAPPRTKPGHRQ